MASLGAGPESPEEAFQWSKVNTIIVTGAASGIGRAFVDALCRMQHSFTIYVIDQNSISPFQRDGRNSEETLRQNIVRYQIDVSNANSVNRIARDFDVRGVAVDLMIHCAGVRGLVRADSIPMTTQDSVQASERLEVMDAETINNALTINALGSFNVFKAFQASLLRAVMADFHPLVLLMGSRMGSISQNIVGGGYAYRMSKAAVNAMMKSLAIDVPQVTWVTIHPGRLQTGLVSVKEDNALPVNTGVEEMLELCHRLRGSDSGRYTDRFGADIPW